MNFCASILKVALPEAFAVLDRHVAGIRRGRQGFLVASQEPTPMSRLREEVDGLRLQPLTAAAFFQVVDFLFGESGKHGRPQSFRHASHVDYWRRYLSNPKIPERERDQTILRCLQNDDDSELLELLENPATSSGVVAFSSQLPSERLTRIFVPTIKKAAAMPRSNAFEMPRALLSTWLIWTQRTRIGSLPPSTVLEQLLKAIACVGTRNLPLVVDLEHYFAERSDDRDMLRDGGTGALRKTVRDTVTGLLTDPMISAQALAESLRDCHPGVLLQICFGVQRIRDEQTTEAPFADWDQFAQVLLERRFIRIERDHAASASWSRSRLTVAA